MTIYIHFRGRHEALSFGGLILIHLAALLLYLLQFLLNLGNRQVFQADFTLDTETYTRKACTVAGNQTRIGTMALPNNNWCR